MRIDTDRCVSAPAPEPVGRVNSPTRWSRWSGCSRQSSTVRSNNQRTATDHDDYEADDVQGHGGPFFGSLPQYRTLSNRTVAALADAPIAAESLARTDPDAWLMWVAKLGQLDMEPAQRLIAHCYASYPEQFARQALTFLLEDPRRYTLGSVGDPTSTSSRLVEKASDHWTEQEIASFENAVGGYRPAAPPDLVEPSDRRSWNRGVRRIKLSLLRALPKNRLTAKMRRYVEEEERVFPDSRLGNRSTGAQFIGYGGISMVPGGDYPVLEALIRIRLEQEEFDQIDEMLRAYLDRCKDPEVWDSLLRFIPYLHSNNTARRAALLERLFTEIPALVETREATRVLVNAHWWNAEFANAQLDRWRDSGNRGARQAYGEMVAVAALMQPALSWAQTRLDTFVEDKTLKDARTGAALTAANLWQDASRRPGAGDLLTRLLAAGGADVWRATFDLFRLTDELTPDPPTVSLLTVIADQIGTAPRLDATFVVERLGTLLPHKAVLVGRVAEGLIGTWRTELGDVRTGTAAAAPQLVDLAVTLHRLGPETREIGTVLFERLIEVDAWEARKTMDEIDNRFLDQAPRRQPRLARRRGARNRGKVHAAGHGSANGT